jgi:hypothetical protein
MSIDISAATAGAEKEVPKLSLIFSSIVPILDSG